MAGMPYPKDNELDQLFAFVEGQREALRLTAHKLTDEQARLAPTASSLSIGGLLKHGSWIERGWIAMATGVALEGAPDYADAFTLGEDETLAGVLALSEAVREETETAVREVGLAHRFKNPKGVPWFPADIDEWDVRWMLLHLVEELARHAGHADIIRETIDGVTMAEIAAEVDGWEMPDWG